MKTFKTWNTRDYDLYIPAPLKCEYYDGNLTPMQVLYLAEIETLVQRGRQRSKHGCYPSNRFLAECQGISIERVRKLNQELKDKGFLIITMKGERRYIKTIWSDAVRNAFKMRKRRKKHGVVGTRP